MRLARLRQHRRVHLSKRDVTVTIVQTHHENAKKRSHNEKSLGQEMKRFRVHNELD